MWVKTAAGNLLNLDHVREIVLRRQVPDKERPRSQDEESLGWHKERAIVAVFFNQGDRIIVDRIPAKVAISVLSILWAKMQQGVQTVDIDELVGEADAPDDDASEVSA